jgi:regulator of RNase E activity RraA
VEKKGMAKHTLTTADLLMLKRWNTPTIYNGWEQITQHDIAGGCFNLEETRDFMPQMGPMVGYAVTVVIEPSRSSHKRNRQNWSEYRRYAASVTTPKIVVIQDLDKPDLVGSFWGEVTSNVHRSLGCVGTITDGGIRDLDEMTNAGFKALARRLCVGHAHVIPVRWGCEIEVFGTNIYPGQLIHADKHGFLAIPPEDENKLLEAAHFMDQNEINHVIRAARETAGKSLEQILGAVDASSKAFSKATQDKFGKKGEW